MIIYEPDVTRIEMLKKSLYSSMEQMRALHSEVMCGIIESHTASEKVEILRKEIKEKKKKIISEVHRGRRGEPLSMGTYNAKRGLFFVSCRDRKLLSAKTEDALLDAMMVHYGLSLESPQIKAIYTRAIERYAKKHPGKDRTAKNFGYDFNRYISIEFGKKDIRDVSTDELETYSLMLAQKGVTVASIKAYKTLLNLIYEQAIFEGLVNQNLAKDVKIKCLVPYCDQSVSHRKPGDVLYSEAEKNALSEHFRKLIGKKPYSPYAFMALLQQELGCRPDEVVCLKWSDFNLGQGVVSIVRQQIEHREPTRFFEVVGFTKNEKGVSKGGRLVPLSSKAIALFNELHEIKEKEDLHSEWLFSNKEGEVLKKCNYSDFLADCCRKLGIKSKGSYAFRRDFNSRMEKNNIPPSERALIMGHTISTNLANYSFGNVDYLDRVREILD